MHIKKIFIIVGLCIYFLFFAELFVRIFDPQPMLPRYVTNTNAGIRGNIPNSKYFHSTPDIKNIEMKINSAGMRSHKEYEFMPKEGVCRIGLFGDSFFMSYESMYENSFAVKLEELLKVKGKNCEVLNFSVSGFGTAESLVRLNTEGLKYGLDIAILEWHKSDPWENYMSQLYAIDNNQALVRDQMNYLPGISFRNKLMKYDLYKFLIQHSHLYSAAREEGADSIKSLISKYRTAIYNMQYYEEDVAQPVTSNRPESAESADSSNASLSSLLIDEFYRLAKDNNIQPYLLEVPFHYTYNNRLESALEFLEGEPKNNIPIISPMDKFHELNNQQIQLYYTNGHNHLSPIGYYSLAEIMAEKIADSSN